jgi:Tfp pilus assembly protein PilV
MGMTIIEVLIAATVFMIGFTIMTFLLGQIVEKYSSKDIVIANQLAQSTMNRTLITNDFTSLEKIDVVSGVSYKIERLIEIKDNLVKLRIVISRHKTNKTLVTLYDEQYFE